jgi:hypothetical protein
MSATYKLFSDKMGGHDTSAYIGKRGEIFYNPTTGNLRLSDGSTSGGVPLAIESLNEVYNGDLIPTTDNTYSLGSSLLRWKEVHIGPGTLFIQDQNNAGLNAAITVLDGQLQINGADQLLLGSVKFPDNTVQTTAYVPGVVHSPRIISGTTSAFTIDFSTDTFIHLHTNAATVTATLSNFTAGKQVDVLIYNNVGGTQQYNHGATSSNATGGNSFYLSTHPTMWVTYVCMDTTSGNCFVKATV